MYTFGFSWKIWKAENPIATADQILDYLNEAVIEQNLVEKIRFGVNVKSASFSSSRTMWTLQTDVGAKYTCNMLFGCTGYYSYELPNKPVFPGAANFKGVVVHPSEWTQEHDKAIIDKSVSIIGSGATAVTLLPNVAKVSKHVTMIQRSPTYIVKSPFGKTSESFAMKWLPESLGLSVNRWYVIFLGWLNFKASKRFPDYARNMLEKRAWEALKGSMSKDDFKKHFSPKYNPWDQRVCLSPNGDFFEAIRKKEASVVTGHIERFVEDGGVMISEVPNFIFTIGYANASWTLKADITSSFACGLLNYMKQNNFAMVKAYDKSGVVEPSDEHIFGLKSGYVQRSLKTMPKQGNKDPWINYQDYLVDSVTLMLKGVEDKENLEFSAADTTQQVAAWGKAHPRPTSRL
eukprot:g8609.t1